MAAAPAPRRQEHPPASGGTPARSAPLDPGVTARLEAMRSHLMANRPASGNEALRLLRAAFPNAPLQERVQAAGETSRWSF